MRKVVQSMITDMIIKYEDLQNWGYKPWSSSELREFTFLCKNKFFAPCIAIHVDEARWQIWTVHYDLSPWDVIGLAHKDHGDVYLEHARNQDYTSPELAVEAMFEDFYIRKSPGFFYGIEPDTLKDYRKFSSDDKKYGEVWYNEWVNKVGKTIFGCKLEPISKETFKQMADECFNCDNPYMYRSPEYQEQQSDEFLEMSLAKDHRRKVVVEHVKKVNHPACHIWLWDSQVGWLFKMPDMEETTIILSPEEAAHWITGGDLPPSRVLDYRCVCA